MLLLEISQISHNCALDEDGFRDLRRLRLHRLIERVPRPHRYRLTHSGLQTPLFYTNEYAPIMHPSL